MEESSPGYNGVILRFTLVSSDRDPVTPQVDGRGEEAEVLREEAEESDESLE